MQIEIDTKSGKELREVIPVEGTPFALLKKEIVDSEEHTKGYNVTHVPTGMAIAPFGWYEPESARAAVLAWWASLPSLTKEAFADAERTMSISPRAARLSALRALSEFDWLRTR